MPWMEGWVNVCYMESSMEKYSPERRQGRNGAELAGQITPRPYASSTLGRASTRKIGKLS